MATAESDCHPTPALKSHKHCIDSPEFRQIQIAEGLEKPESFFSTSTQTNRRVRFGYV